MAPVPFRGIMKTSDFPSSCPGQMWGVVAAIIFLSTVQSKQMTQGGYFRNDTAKEADASQAGVDQSLVRPQIHDIKVTGPKPSSDSNFEISHDPGLYNLTLDVYSSDVSNNSNEYVDVDREENETEASGVSPIDGDEQVYDNEENEIIDDERDFNVTAAIDKGIQAQYELCDSFCEQNSTLVVHQGTDNCYFSDTLCYLCSCDHACAKYGDCCPLNGSTSMPRIAFQPHLCVEVNIGRGTYGVEVIATCPENDSVQGMNCIKDCNSSSVNHTHVLKQLVMSSDTHAVYCNGDCALCNGDTNFTTVMTLECKTAYNVPNSRHGSDFRNVPSFQDTEAPLGVSSKRCVTAPLNGSDIGQTTCFPVYQDTTPLPPVVNVTQCELFLPEEHWRFIRSCGSNAPLPIQPQSMRNHTVPSNATYIGAIEDLCFQYSYPIQIGDTIYRNLFCALRNGVAPSGFTCVSTATYRVDTAEHHTPMSVLTSLHNPIMVYMAPSFSSTECLDRGDGWYDVAIDKCRPVSCENGREWLTGQPFCVQAVPRTNTTIVYTYMLYVVFQPRANSTKFGCSPYWADVRHGAVDHLAGMMHQLNVTVFVIQMHCDVYLSKMFVYVEFMVDPADGEGQIEFELEVLDQFAVSSLPESVVSGVQLDMTLTSGFLNWEAQLTWIPFLNGSCCDQTVIFHDLDLISLHRNMTTDPSPSYIRTVLGPFTPYAQVLLNVTEFDRFMDDRYNLTYANISLAARKVFEIQNGLVVPFLFLQDTYVQAGLVQNPQIEIRYRSDEIEYRILSSCLIVSVTSLVFLLTTYSVFSELRTLPGINTMFLASWLLVAQLLLLVVPGRTEVAPVCRALGVALHYSWLCVVSWCSVCSFHMFDVFVRQQNRMHMPHRQGWYIKRYVAVAHSLPALVILLVVVCTVQDVGYGGHRCYLNSVLLVGLAFFLPLALSVLINLVLLILTARAVSLVKRQHVSVATGAERGSVQIYIGLSSLTGLCWVVALLAEVPGCGFLGYVSAVLNGLQGLHLALSYAGSKRVMKMWRHKLRCSATTSGSQNSASRSSSSTQSRRTIPTYV